MLGCSAVALLAYELSRPEFEGVPDPQTNKMELHNTWLVSVLSSYNNQPNFCLHHYQQIGRLMTCFTAISYELLQHEGITTDALED